MRKIFFAWLCLCAVVCAAQRWEEPVATGEAVAEIRLEKSQVYFGEPFRVAFVVRNTDANDISIESGGDSRGVNRALRFRVQAVNADGVAVPDAENFGCMGGFLGLTTLAPGKEWKNDLWPLDYVRLTEPGVYTLRITHDLGWGKEDGAQHGLVKDPPFLPEGWNAPVGEAQVEFLMPDAQKAAEILDAIAEAIANNDRTKIPSAVDLAFPVYLPLLKPRILAGETFCLEALGEIATKDATEVLLELAEDAAFPYAAAAASLLLQRLPRDTPPRSGFFGEKTFPADAVWDDAYTPRVRDIARKLVAAFNPYRPGPKPAGVGTGYFRGMFASEFHDVDVGARILARIGTAEDYDVLRKALEKAIDRLTADSPRVGADANILDFPAPMPDLIDALDALHTRGAKLRLHWFGSAETYLYFRWAANDPILHPPAWRTNMTTHVAANYPTQIAFLKSVPTPMTPQHRNLVLETFTAKDLGVLNAACGVAGHSGDNTFLPEVLAIVRTETHDMVFAAACAAAEQLGARLELARTLAERLPESEFGGTAESALKKLTGNAFKPDATSGSKRLQRIAKQAAWRTWIAEHADEVEAGKKSDMTGTAE